MAPPRLGPARNVNRTSRLVNEIVRTAGGGEADEAFLLNGLAILGYDVGLLQGLSDRDPNRKFVNDAVVRAMRAGISQADIEKAMKVGAYLSGRDIEKNFQIVSSLPPEQREAARRAETQRPFAFKGEAPPPPPGPAPGVPAPPAPARGGLLPNIPITPPPAPAAPPGPVSPGVPSTRQGVMDLQRALNAQGAGLTVDGQYGPKTRAAHQRLGGAPAPAAAPGGTLGGGTRLGAPSPGVVNLPTLAPNAPEAEVEAYIRKHYGFSAWALDIPELRGALLDVARQFAGAPDIDESAIEGRLGATEWWKTHTDVQRQKIEERGEDPATYNAGVEGAYRTLNVLMGQLGFTIPEGRLREVARTSYEFGWDTASQRAALAAEFDYDPTTGAQDQSAVVGDLRGLAADYLVPLSEATIDQWGRQIIAGTSRNEDFTEYAKGIAKGMFAHYATDIDAGRTIRQIADPFVEQAARDLELTPDQIDLMDPRWRKALELDPETGQPMQLSKWQQTIRSDSSYGWDKTNNARTEAAEFTKKILEAFGRR